MKWIKVSDKLPEDMKYVLIVYQDGYMRIMAHLSDLGEEKWYDHHGEFIYKKYHKDYDLITHWMPLPPNPEYYRVKEMVKAASKLEDFTDEEMCRIFKEMNARIAREKQEENNKLPKE